MAISALIRRSSARSALYRANLAMGNPAQWSFHALRAPPKGIPNGYVLMSASGPGCVKTRVGRASAQQLTRQWRTHEPLLPATAVTRINVARSGLENSFHTAWVTSRRRSPDCKWSAIAPGADIGPRYVCFQGRSGRRSTTLRTTAHSHFRTFAMPVEKPSKEMC